MRILHINTQSEGGAANAALNLHRGLLASGHESHFLTLASNNEKIENQIEFPQFSRYGLSVGKRLKNKLHIKPLKAIERQRAYEKLDAELECFSSPRTDYKLAEFIQDELDVDIVNLHWVGNFLDYNEFFSNIKIPVVWTLHDQNPFSSYWHYSRDHIQTSKALDLHQTYIEAKQRAIHGCKGKIEIAAPSVWLKTKSLGSPVLGKFPHHHIPYGVDTRIFKPTDEWPTSLGRFNRSEDQVVGLFICQSINNERKGMHLLLNALNQVSEELNIRFIAVGKIDEQLKQEMPSNIFFTGEIQNKEELARLYNLADFTLLPSLQDNLPNTMLESLCSGTPVLGTPAGGIRETIERDDFGSVAKDFNPRSLAEIIDMYTSKASMYDKNTIAARAQELFNLKVQSREYIRIYHRLLN